MSRGEQFVGCSQDVFRLNEQHDDPFCSQDNWKNAVVFLSQELQLLGLPSICPGRDNVDLIALINCTWSLMQSHLAAVKSISDLESQLRRMSGQLENLESSHSRQRDLLEMKERQAAMNEQKERRNQQLIQCSQQLLKAQKDECKRLSGLLTYRDAQFQRELKKKDDDLAKMKERLMKMLMDKSGSTLGGSKMQASSLFCTPAIEMSCLLDKPSSMSRSRWNGSSAQPDDLHRKAMRDVRERCQMLSLENQQLREDLLQLQAPLLQWMQHQSGYECSPLASLLPDSLSRDTVHSTTAVIQTHLQRCIDQNPDATCECSALRCWLQQAELRIQSVQSQLLEQNYSLAAYSPPPDQSDSGPTWSHGALTCATPPPSGRRACLTVIPVFSRLTQRSQPTSRSHSGCRHPESSSSLKRPTVAAAGDQVKTPRPKSTVHSSLRKPKESTPTGRAASSRNSSTSPSSGFRSQPRSAGLRLRRPVSLTFRVGSDSDDSTATTGSLDPRPRPRRFTPNTSGTTSEDDLTVHLDHVGRLMEANLSGGGDSEHEREMERHLDRVRQALMKHKLHQEVSSEPESANELVLG